MTNKCDFVLAPYLMECGTAIYCVIHFKHRLQREINNVLCTMSMCRFSQRTVMLDNNESDETMTKDNNLIFFTVFIIS